MSNPIKDKLDEAFEQLKAGLPNDIKERVSELLVKYSEYSLRALAGEDVQAKLNATKLALDNVYAGANVQLSKVASNTAISVILEVLFKLL